jgi:hypothetical protein
MGKRRVSWGRIWDAPPAYVFLFPLYPVLFLYYQNIREVAFIKILPPMALALALAAALWLGLRPIVTDREKRGAVVFLLLLLFFYFKLILDALASAISQMGRPFSALPPAVALGAFAALAVFCILRSKRPLGAAGKILSAITLALLAWNVGGIVVFHARRLDIHNARAFLQKGETRLPVAPAAAKPDIYCFFVDEFASLDTIADLFHHDNSAFAERMRAAGFFIAEQSRSLYAWTPEAIASVLNMEPLPAKTDPALLIRQNKVSRFLKELGYAIVDFPYEGLTALDDSQRHYAYDQERASVFFNDFYRTLAEMSLLYPLVEKWQGDDARYALYFRKRVLYVFEQMPGVVTLPGPKFVLVHLFSPHAPFVFDKDGGVVPPERATDYSERKYYLEQYLYIGRRLAETVEMILKNSSSPPIIIVQSDHGYRGSIRKPFLHVVSEAEKRKIFLALHLPGYPQARLGSALAPTQVFRLILNHYFGQSLAGAPSPVP